MTDKKFTDEEIIKALEVCKTSDSCRKCPINPNYGNFGYCTSLAMGYALDLINRQKAEIERLEEANTNTKRILNEYLEASGARQIMREAKAEAIKEFAERLRKEAWFAYRMGKFIVDTDNIDQIAKELTEEKK